MEAIPDAYHDLFAQQTFAHVATLLPDGMPHVTPVWIDYDEETGYIQFNTERGRRKERNVRQNPHVGVSMLDPDDPYRFLSAWGDVEEITAEGAIEHIDALAQRYMGVDEYPHHDEEEGERVIVKIAPRRVVTGGE
jgi:PPOX class probable F420-dependent enzyme